MAKNIDNDMETTNVIRRDKGESDEHEVETGAIQDPRDVLDRLHTLSDPCRMVCWKS